MTIEDANSDADSIGPDDEGSVTRVIRRMKKGHDEGADLVWERFFVRLKRLVRDKLYSQMRIVSDEEDVALDSLAELFDGLRNGKYPALKGRESVWKLLVTVASRNVLDEINKEKRIKRGSGRVYNESALSPRHNEDAGIFERIPSNTLPPDVKMMIAERCTDMLESLNDDKLQAIALLKTTGATNQQVADTLQLSLRSVERRLGIIRDHWKSA